MIGSQHKLYITLAGVIDQAVLLHLSLLANYRFEVLVLPLSV